MRAVLASIAGVESLVAAMLLAGCASWPGGRLITEPVGPTVGAQGALAGRSTAYLRVYSETEPYNDGGFVSYRHTPYSVYDTNGHRVKGVANRVGMTDQRPMTVDLPPGRYRVAARAEGYGLVEVPVVLVGARLTEVYLERPGITDLGDVPETEGVRLPDGRVIGRRAPAAAVAPSR